MSENNRTVVANGRSYTYILTRKHVKNAIMHIDPDAIRVSAPPRMPLSAIDALSASTPTPLIAHVKNLLRAKPHARSRFRW